MESNTKKPEKNRVQKRAKRTRKKLKDAALDVFSEQSIDATTVEDITEKADVGKGTLYQHFEDKEEIVVTLVDPLKVRRLACAVAGFVFGFFSFAMIGMTEDEMETSIKPLRQVFVKNLCTFLGR